MIERLQRALARIDELSPTMQEDLAQHIEDLAGPATTFSAESADTKRHIQVALGLAGAWSDLPDTFDEMLDTLDAIRHASLPTPPVDEQLAWLDEPHHRDDHA